MKLHNITLTNWRSFKGEQTFHFPDAPGLYFMQGINKVEPQLQGNGSGKSSIWEGLTWILHDKTSASLRAGDVCNWEVVKGTKVKLVYQEDDAVSMQVLERTWKPNTWTLTDLFGNVSDLIKDASNPALAAIRTEFTPWLHSVMMAQGQPMFLDLGKAEQAALFSKVMNLDVWLDHSERAARKASDQDRSSRDLERELSRLQGLLAGMRDYTTEIDQFNAKRAKRIRKLEGPYQEELKQSRALKEEIQTLFDRADKCRVAYQAALKEVDGWKPVLAELTKQVESTAKTYHEAYAIVDPAREHLQFLKEHDHCPTCDQDIDPKTKAAKIGRAQNNLMKCESARDITQDIWEDKQVSLHKTQKLHEGSQDNAAKQWRHLTDADDAVKSCQQDLNMVNKHLDIIEDEVETLQAEENPYQKLHKEALDGAKTLRQDIRTCQRSLDHSNERQSLFSYWVRGFKELRLQIIAEALTELEIEVNSCVAELGLVEWELLFQVDKETKGGNISRGFNVQVRSPDSPRLVPWEAWSGGEKQRLRVAATLGMSNLTRTRCGITLPLEVWDEPSTHLSPQGVRNLLEALERRAKVEQRQIWLVDHTAHSFGGFAGGAMITKTPKGSVIEQY